MDSAPHLAEKSSGCDMMTESLTIQVLHIISSALTPIEQWEAAKRYFYTASSAEARLTVFAVVALIILVILLFWLSAKRRNSEHRLKSNRTEVVNMLLWLIPMIANLETVPIIIMPQAAGTATEALKAASKAPPPKKC